MTYTFKYKRKFWWKKETVVGHSYNQEQDKMVIYYPDGGLKEIAGWRQCSVRLGADWVAVTKKSMEKEAGVSVPLNN